MDREEHETPAGTYSAIDAGWDHACAIGEGGKVVCWLTGFWDEFGQTEVPF